MKRVHAILFFIVALFTTLKEYPEHRLHVKVQKMLANTHHHEERTWSHLLNGPY